MVSLRRRGWWFLGLVAGLGACSSPLPSSVCATSITYTTTYTTAVNHDVDLVFVIDDSAAMAGWQAQLAAQLPVHGCREVCHCPTPSGLHIGVVSSDLGVGAAHERRPFRAARASGDGGQFRSQPEGTCTDTTLDPGGDIHLRHRQRAEFQHARTTLRIWARQGVPVHRPARRRRLRVRAAAGGARSRARRRRPAAPGRERRDFSAPTPRWES